MGFDDEIAAKIYRNGILLVTLGIIDSRATERRQQRIVTSIVNSYAGILLLLKAELASRSAVKGYDLLWTKAYLKWKAKHPGMEGQPRTANYDEIRRRISGIAYDGVDWPDFWAKLDVVHDYRCDIEHRYSDLNADALKVHLAHVCEIVDLIFSRIIGVNPADELEEAWEILSQIASVVKRQEKERNDEFGGLTWMNTRLRELAQRHVCPKCGYQIMRVKERGEDGTAMASTFRCGSCNKVFEYGDMMDDILKTQSFKDYGWRVKDEWFAPRHIGTCPECNRYGFDAETDTCYCCGHTYDYICQSCEEPLTIDEIETLDFDDSCFIQCAECRHRDELMKRDD